MLELKLVLHDAKTDPPKRSMSADECIGIICGGYFNMMCYSAKHNAFNVRDEDEGKRLEIKPIFWAEAPAELRGLFKGV